MRKPEFLLVRQESECGEEFLKTATQERESNVACKRSLVRLPDVSRF